MRLEIAPKIIPPITWTNKIGQIFLTKIAKIFKPGNKVSILEEKDQLKRPKNKKQITAAKKP